MTALVVTTAYVSPVNDTQYESHPYTCAATVTQGQAVYETSVGKVNLARGNAVGTAKCVGIALQGGGAGQTIDVFQRGRLYGFGLATPAYGDVMYLSSATAGALDDTIISGSGNVITPIAWVDAMNDSDKTKVLFVDIDMLRVPAALA